MSTQEQEHHNSDSPDSPDSQALNNPPSPAIDESNSTPIQKKEWEDVPEIQAQEDFPYHSLSDDNITEDAKERNAEKIKQLGTYDTARYRIHQTSALYFSWTNQSTYILQADFPQTILNGFRPGLVPNSQGVNYLNYFFASISYLSLGMGNTATYQKFIYDLFGLEQIKSPATIKQKIVDILKVNISSLIKGGVSSISFGNSLANIMGYLGGWGDPLKAKVASSVATVLFPINWYSQQMNFNYGLNKSEEKPTDNKTCWNSLYDAIPWELIKKVAKIVYPLTSPLTYNVTFQKDFPILVAQITNLIKPEIPQEKLQNEEWLGWLTFAINICCFMALAYDTLKLYNKMDKKKPQTVPADTSDPSINTCVTSTKSFLEGASQHIAANSKGLISSLGFAEFVCNTIKEFYPSASSKDLAIINTVLSLIGIVFNTPAQYASFSIAAKDKEKNKSPVQNGILNNDNGADKIVHQGKSFPEQSFMSFCSPQKEDNDNLDDSSHTETPDEDDLSRSYSRTDSEIFSPSPSNSVSSIADEPTILEKNKNDKKRKLPSHLVIDVSSWKTIPEFGKNPLIPHLPTKVPQKKKPNTHTNDSKAAAPKNNSAWFNKNSTQDPKTDKSELTTEKGKDETKSKGICLVM